MTDNDDIVPRLRDQVAPVIFDDDIAAEMRDWAAIIEESHDKAAVIMLSGSPFTRAAAEIERLRADLAYYRIAADGYEQEIARLQRDTRP